MSQNGTAASTPQPRATAPGSNTTTGPPTFTRRVCTGITWELLSLLNDPNQHELFYELLSTSAAFCRGGIADDMEYRYENLHGFRRRVPLSSKTARDTFKGYDDAVSSANTVHTTQRSRTNVSTVSFITT